MLYVRHETTTDRMIVRLDGTVDEFRARLLVSTIEASAASTIVIDLGRADFSSDAAQASFARLFLSGRHIFLRGLGPRHDALLRAMRKCSWDRVA